MPSRSRPSGRQSTTSPLISNEETGSSLLALIRALPAERLRNAFTHDGIHDTGCSLKVFRRPVVERLQLFEGMHRFFPALAKMHGFTLAEVPVRHFPRAHGRSKYGIGNRLFKGLYDLVAVRWMMRRVLRYRVRECSRAETRDG